MQESKLPPRKDGDQAPMLARFGRAASSLALKAAARAIAITTTKPTIIGQFSGSPSENVGGYPCHAATSRAAEVLTQAERGDISATRPRRCWLATWHEEAGHDDRIVVTQGCLFWASPLITVRIFRNSSATKVQSSSRLVCSCVTLPSGGKGLL